MQWIFFGIHIGYIFLDATLVVINLLMLGLLAVCGALTVPSNAPTLAPPPSTPILFVHGQDDDVLPADASVQAQQWFNAKGYPTELHLIPGLGHGLDAQALAHITVFLQRIWQL